MSRILIIIAYLLVCSCSSDQATQGKNIGKHEMSDDKESYNDDIEITRTSQAPTTPISSLQKGSKIIKTGNLSFEVSQLERSKSKIDSLVKIYSSYFENEIYKSHGNRNTYSLKLRIPTANFDSLVDQLETGIGELKSKNINAKDVTEEYLDLNIRLENNLAYLKQYQEILKKAKSIKEILEVQQRIRQIEIEIESKKGRIKYLDDNVKYSTLDIELSELISKNLSNTPNFWKRLANASNSGVQGFLTLIVGLVSLWPFLFLALGVFIIRKPILRRLKS